MNQSDIIRTIVSSSVYGLFAFYMLRMVERLINKLIDKLIPAITADAAAKATLSEKIDALSKKDKTP